MIKDNEIIVNVLKEQAELFLLDAQAFYPFATALNKQNEIIPIGAYLGNDHESALEIINFLENAIKEGLLKGNYRVAALAINVNIKEDEKVYDAIEIRFFNANKESYSKYLKYILRTGFVEFYE